MPRVKKKSVEYGNRKRKKLAAARRSIFYNLPPMVDGSGQSAVQMTGERMPPTPPLTSLDTDDFKTDNDMKYHNRRIMNLDSKLNILKTAEIKVEQREFKSIRPIKGLSELISKSIITAEDAAAAVSAVTTMASLKKALVVRKTRTPKQPKQSKLQEQTNVKVSLPPSTKTPVLSTTSTTSTVTANPGKLLVNIKGFGNPSSSSSSTSTSTSTGGNTQKAYALYVGGQLKYILPYNGAFSSTQQQSNEMKKFICRGVNGKTEIALARPTVVCDDEKKKIVFVVQKKATPTSPTKSLLAKSDQNILKIPTVASLSTTPTGQFLQGNQIISDNMLKLLLLPAMSANNNSNNPITLPSPVLSSGGQAQKVRTSPPQTTQVQQQTPVTKVPSSFSIPIVVKVQGQSVSTATPTTTTTTTSSSSSTIGVTTTISAPTTSATTTGAPTTSPTTTTLVPTTRVTTTTLATTTLAPTTTTSATTTTLAPSATTTTLAPSTTTTTLAPSTTTTTLAPSTTATTLAPSTSTTTTTLAPTTSTMTTTLAPTTSTMTTTLDPTTSTTTTTLVMTPNPAPITPTSSITTDMTNHNVKPQTSPVSSSSSSPPSTSTSSVRPVQLFTRDSARKLCPAVPVLLTGNKPCMTILDPTDPGANIRPGKSLLGNSEPTQSVSKQGTTGANQILVKKTFTDTSVILEFKDGAGVSSFMPASDKDPKLSEKSPTRTNDAQLQLHPQSVTPVSLASNDKTETMPNITAPPCEEEEENDEDDGMFGLKISSVFSLAENQPCSEATEAVMDQERKLLHDTLPTSFQQDPIPPDTLTTAMKLAVSSGEAKSNKANCGVNSLTNQRTVIVDLNTNNGSCESLQENRQIVLNPSKHTSSEKCTAIKLTVNVEQQKPTSFSPDLESVLSDKLSVDVQTNCPQKENASPEKASPLAGSEKDFLAGQKYITVDIFRHNGQTKITAVSSSGKKEVTKPSCQSISNGGGGGGASSSSSDETKLTAPASDARLHEVLQCAAFSLPMGTYFFIPLHDKTVAIPSQRHKKNRSAYIFEKTRNCMQVKMAKYMILNSKNKLPSSIVMPLNGSQLVCQISNPSKTNGESAIVLPVPSMLPIKDLIPTLEAPPIVTGKRIRRPKKHTDFEEDMDMIPPLRKSRKRLKPVNKAEKNVRNAVNSEKHSEDFMTNLEDKNIAFVSSTTTTNTTTATINNNNKLLLHPAVDSKEGLAAILRSVNMPVTVSSKNNNTNSMSYVFVPQLGTSVSTSKLATPVSSATNTISQDFNQSGLHIDNVLSLQPGAVKIKSEPITSGYGDEPIKDLSPLLTPTPSAQIGRDALGMPYTIKKEPSWYGYEPNPSSAPLLSSISHSDQMKTTTNTNLKNVSASKETYNCQTQYPALYKRDSPTKSPTGKKRGRKKKVVDETKPEVKKRKYVRHKTETVVSKSSPAERMSAFSSFPLKNEIKTEAPEPSQTGASSRQSGETPQEERIRRLKEILREKEQTLEEIRHNLSVTQNVA